MSPNRALNILIGNINSILNVMAPSLPAYPQGENNFRLSMTLSMITGVSVLSVLIYKDVRKNYKMAVPIVAMKFASVFSVPGFFAAGFICGITERTALADLVIFITDLPLGLFMQYIYRKVKNERMPVSGGRFSPP